VTAASPSPGELLTPEEVAARLHTTLRFVRRLIAERRIAFTKIGKFVRISADDLDAFIAAGRVEPGVSYIRPSLWAKPADSRNGRG
jgi:excisionase family DNA binding protein